MSNVVPLRGDAVIHPGMEVNPNVVTCLEDLLQRARSGEICGVAVAYQFTDKSTNITTGGEGTRSMVGAIEALKIFVMRAIEDI